VRRVREAVALYLAPTPRVRRRRAEPQHAIVEQAGLTDADS
jgi:hypothetical protein